MWYLLILGTACTTMALSQQAHLGAIRLPPPSGVTVQPTTTDEATSASLQGEVQNAVTGEPIRSATLRLRRVFAVPDTGDSPSKYSAFTDEHGRFFLKGIPPGAYRLSAAHTAYVPTEFGAREVIGVGTPLSIDAGSQLGGVILRLMPQVVLAGRVVDESGDPLAHVEVQALGYRYNRGRSQLSIFGHATSNDLGEYRIFGLAPGRYYLSANCHPNAAFDRQAIASTDDTRDDEDYLPIFYPRGTDPAFATTIDARPGAQLTGIDFILTKSPAVHMRGRVNNAIGKGMVSVTVNPADQTRTLSFSRTCLTDSKGRFELRGIAPGAYTIVASLLGGDSPLTARRRVDLTTNVDDFVITLRPQIALAGRVRAEGNKVDLSSVRVSLQRRGAATSYGILPTARTNSDGSFTLSDVSPDHYYLAVTETPPGYYLKSAKVADKEILEEGFTADFDHVDAINVVLTAGAALIEIAVLNGRGQPAPGATVVLVPNDSKRRDQVQFYRITAADNRGRCLMNDVAPGTYRLFAWDDVEFDAWMNPDFLTPIEDQAQSVSVEEKAHLRYTVQLIQPEGSDHQRLGRGHK